MKKFFIVLSFIPFLFGCEIDQEKSIDNLSIDDLEEHISIQIIEAKYCVVDADCIDLGNFCPFGCQIAINQREKSEILGLIRQYENKLESDGIGINCEPCPLPGWIQCMRGVCTTLFE